MDIDDVTQYLSIPRSFLTITDSFKAQYLRVNLDSVDQINQFDKHRIFGYYFPKYLSCIFAEVPPEIEYTFFYFRSGSN